MLYEKSFNFMQLLTALAAVLRVRSRFGKIRVIPFDHLVLRPVGKLIGEWVAKIRRLGPVGVGFALDSAFLSVAVWTCNQFCSHFVPRFLFFVGRWLRRSNPHAHPVQFTACLRSFRGIRITLNQAAQIADAGIPLIRIKLGLPLAELCGRSL